MFFLWDFLGAGGVQRKKEKEREYLTSHGNQNSKKLKNKFPKSQNNTKTKKKRLLEVRTVVIGSSRMKHTKKIIKQGCTLLYKGGVSIFKK